MKGIVHHIDDTLLAASFNNLIYTSLDHGKTWKKLDRIPITKYQEIQDRSSLLSRLLRNKIHHISCFGQNEMIVIGYGFVFTIDRKSGRVVNASSIIGKRPLVLCSTGSGVYYGEYRDNPERTPVCVWANNSGSAEWREIFKFEGIRHIHGVFNDQYDNKIWVTTGDKDEESGIWVTDNNFKTLNKVAHGSQQVRVIQLLFTEKHVYFGSDAPSEVNFIYRLDRKTNKIEKLQEVGNSVFWGCKVRDHLFFSTAVEPSKINKNKYACVWGTKDGENWKRVVSFRKDMWNRKFFQYGQILFPSGENNTDYLWFTPFATERHMTVQRLNVKDVL